MNKVKRLRKRARHYKTQASYNAEQEGISKRNDEIAQSIIADGEPVSRI